MSFLNKEFAKDVLITAVEGGIGYWSHVSGYNPDEGIVTVHPLYKGDFETKTVTYKDIQKAIKKVVFEKMIAKFLIADILNDNVDSEVADCIMQVAVLGAVEFG